MNRLSRDCLPRRQIRLWHLLGEVSLVAFRVGGVCRCGCQPDDVPLVAAPRALPRPAGLQCRVGNCRCLGVTERAGCGHDPMMAGRRPSVCALLHSPDVVANKRHVANIQRSHRIAQGSRSRITFALVSCRTRWGPRNRYWMSSGSLGSSARMFAGIVESTCSFE